MNDIRIRYFETPQPYGPIFEAMRAFTLARQPDTPDEIWFLEHTPVFTQGQAGKPEHILHTSDIPIVQSDRGGQVTYHGPGQLMGYLLLDLKRYGFTVRSYVQFLEHSIIKLLHYYNITGFLQPGAPGVYIHLPDASTAKIASLGIRVRKNCSYHGVSININLDLSPFNQINPCGFKNLSMAKIADFTPDITIQTVQALLTTLWISPLQDLHHV